MPFVSSIVVIGAIFATSIEFSAAFRTSRSHCPSVAARTATTNRPHGRGRIKLRSGGPDDGPPPPKKHLSASQKERRDEERRRRDRLEEGFATPGLSSAIPGARDFPIDVAGTEEEYLRSLGGGDDDCVVDDDNADKFAALWTEEGLAHLRMMRFREASESFGKVYGIKPETYLWQDGLLKYYLGDYRGAAESLAKNAHRYETRFMESASEERIWRDAAELKIRNSLNGRRSKKNTPDVMKVPVEEGVDEEQGENDNIANERRKVFRLARQLFSNSLRNNSAGVALARAQLQALCNDSYPSSLKSTLPTMPKSKQTKSSTFKVQPDRKMYRLHSLFYLGLHFDALGQSYESKQCMKMALKACANSISGNNQDITYLLPVIHMTIRDWYDDDEFNTDESEEALDLAGDDLMTQLVNDGGIELELAEKCDVTSTSQNAKVYNNKNNPQEQRLRESIKHMKIIDLKGELKRRKLRVSGSKRVLQDRLIEDLKKKNAN